LLADRYLGSKRAVKFGAIIMSLGYLILSVGAGMGTEAKPFATIEGQRYEVTIDKASADKQQYVTIGADKLRALIATLRDIEALHPDPGGRGR